MQITGKDIRWTISGAAQDLAPYAALEAGRGPQGGDACRVTVSREGVVEASEERIWEVESGRAYQLTILNRAESERCHGRAYLIWLDADKKPFAEVSSVHTFARHDYTPLVINAVAPDQAHYARSAFRVRPDSWPDFTGVQGSFVIDAAELRPSIAFSCKATVPGALYDADKPVLYRISLSAAPASAERCELRYKLTDYELRVLQESSMVIALNGGAGDAELELPVLGPGYYELHVVASTRGLADVALTRSFGCLGALDFTPAQDSPIALDAGISHPFTHGLASSSEESDPQRLAEQVATCSKLGLRNLRDRFTWQHAQPSPDKMEWGKYKVAAEAQKAGGIDVYQMLSGVPSWAMDPNSEELSFGEYPPNDMRKVYEFCARAAREMGHAIRYWELWNEPDIFFFAGHPWDLAAISKAGALGFKDADPTIGVLGASRCAGPTFWQRWLANGPGPYIDIFNQHSYGKPEDQFAMIQENRDLMADVGMQRPIWMTEMGKRSIPDPDGTYTLAERIQVVYMLRAFASGLASGIERFFYFYLQEFLEAGAAVWGIQRVDLSPMPAVLALGTLIRQIGRAKLAGYLIDDERYLVVFERLPGEYTAMAWSTKNMRISDGWGAPNPVLAEGEDWMAADGAFDLPVSAGAYLVDALGRQIEACSGATHHVKLSLCPVYVRGIDPARLTLTPPPPMLHYKASVKGLARERYIWLQAQARPNEPRPGRIDAQEQKNALQIRAGEAEEVAFLVHNYTDAPAKAALQLDETAGWRIERVLRDGEELGSARRLALEVPANGTRRVEVRYAPQELSGETTWCFKARLYLDGAPHDQAAVWVSTERARRSEG
ncbi:MAG: hypothetical protein GXY52_01970 [Chloroflexi bacterium]|nr:hypothetical protein [Chloroflexota bacterium]